MKKIPLSLLFFIPILAFAQPGPGGPGGDRMARLKESQERMQTLVKEAQERIQTLEIAYLTKELSLSSEEAQKFWPVFNKYREEIRTIAYNKTITDPLDKQQKMLDVRKKYRGDFNKILGQQRTDKIYISEGRFKEMVGREMANRRLKEMRKGPEKGGQKRIEEFRKRNPGQSPNEY